MTKENDQLLKAALKRMQRAHDADSKHRERAEDDLSFLVGEQWDEETRTEREADGKPCLVINALPQFVRQITAQIRNLNPAIRISPADGEASKDTAEVFEGLIRQIQNTCDAPSIYEEAAASAASCGIGHWRIRTQYAEGMTFDQEVILERIYNPFAVFWDPAAKDPTRKDAQFCFVVEALEREDFEEQYPDAKADSTPVGGEGSKGRWTWTQGDQVFIAEYFWIDSEKVEIAELSDGRVLPKDEAEKLTAAPLVTLQAPPTILRTRKMDQPRVKWAKITGSEVLEGPQDFPGRYIPIVSVTGEEIHLGEDVYRSSVIRFAKDPQRLYNYGRSAQAEVVGQQPTAPYLVTATQVKGYEDYWANPGGRAYLPYNHDDKAGPPKREMPPVASQGLSQEISLASEDLKRTTGIYDASLGARSNETSGIAIARRQQESAAANSIYADNMVKSIIHTGNILLDVIPRVYDTARVILILGEDKQEQIVEINQVMMDAQGQIAIKDLSIGKYACIVNVGPTFQTRREEAQEGMMKFLETVPQAAPVAADLIAGMQDWPEADRIAKRLRIMLPPQLQEPDEQDPQAQAAAQQQAQQQQAEQQQAQQLAQTMQQLDVREKEAKAAKAEADAHKARFEAMEAQARLGLVPPPQIPTAPPAVATSPQPQPPQGGFLMPRG